MKLSTQDQQNNETVEQESGRDELTMPLGVGSSIDSTIDLSAGGAPTRGIRSGTLLLGLVVIVAVVGLFSMRTLARLTAAATGSTEIEKTVNDFLNKVSGAHGDSAGAARTLFASDQDTALRVLTDDRTDHQVPLTDVQKDPFVLSSGPSSEPAFSQGDTDAERNRKLEALRAERRDLVQKAVDKLRLKSVMLGAEPLANLSGRIVHLNESVPMEAEGIELVVTSIRSGSITLVNVDRELQLNVEVTLELQKK